MLVSLVKQQFDLLQHRVSFQSQCLMWLNFSSTSQTYKSCLTVLVQSELDLNTSANTYSLCLHTEQANKPSEAHTHAAPRANEVQIPQISEEVPSASEQCPVSLPEAQRWPSSVGKNVCVCVSPSAAFSSELRVLQDRPVRLFSSAPLSNTHYNPASRSECVDVRANTAAFLTSRERLKCWLTFPVHSSQKKDIHTIYGYGLREVRSKRSTYELNERTARKSSCRLLPFPFPSHFVALPFSLSLSLPLSLPFAHCYETDREKILRKIHKVQN